MTDYIAPYSLYCRMCEKDTIFLSGMCPFNHLFSAEAYEAVCDNDIRFEWTGRVFVFSSHRNMFISNALSYYPVLDTSALLDPVNLQDLSCKVRKGLYLNRARHLSRM
jgi:hypothetical protein